MSVTGRAGIILSVLLVVATAGCSSSSDGGDDAPAQRRPTVEYASSQEPSDRDSEAVSATLGGIDPCALLDSAVSDVAAFGKSQKPEADGPHSCSITNADYDDVSVVLGNELPAEERYTRKLQTLGGAKAYVESQDDTFCRVALPVSFTHAVEFVGSTNGRADACRSAREFAISAAKQLWEPGALQQLEGPDRWVACDLLRSGIGEVPDDAELRMGSDFLAGMDECGQWPAQGKKLGSGVEIEPVAPDIKLTVEYGDLNTESTDRSIARVRGRSLYPTQYGDDSCTISWTDWKPSAGGAERGDRTLMDVEAPTCKRAKGVARGVIKAADSGQPASEPTTDLLYRDGEPDLAAPRGCEDLLDFESLDCAAYEPVDVPSRSESLVRKAAVDPDIACAMALDVVREHYGDAMRPIIAEHGTDASGEPTRSCGFVEETHSRQVWLSLSTEPLSSAGSETEIAGHRAVEPSAVSDDARQLWVAAGPDEDSGHVRIEVAVTPDRNSGMYSDSPVDRRPLRRLDAFTSDLLAEHF